MRASLRVAVLAAGLGGALFGHGIAGAQTPPGPQATAPGEDPEMANLMAILHEETAIATKTRMNSDFVPGIVTVLHGDELEAMGVETVWEALSLVPGMQPVRERTGLFSVIVRGLPFPFNSGNVRVLMNGLALGRENAGINGISLQVPIQMVDRIEVIRGPGSVVHGDFAFMGLVNIVTRAEGTRLHVRAGGDHAVGFGASHASTDPGTGLSVAVTGSASFNQDAPVAAPREAREGRGSGSLIASYKGFSLTAEAESRDVEQTNRIQGEPATGDQSHWALDARYARDLASTLHAELHAGVLSNRFNTSPSSFDGSVTDAGLDLRWDGWRGHSWLLGVSASSGDIARARQVRPRPPGTPGPPLSLIVENESRDAFGVTLQDTIDLGSSVVATVGARYDHTSDTGDRLTPRLALVWRASDHHILKLQYAEGFRAPTFFEQYSRGARNVDLRPEVNGTTELNYVYRRATTVGRVTLFHSKIRNMIYVGRDNVFDNTHTARSYGAEVELEQQLGPKLKALANVSWVDSETDRNATSVSVTPAPKADWLGNVALLYRATPRTLLALRWNHVGARNATAGDNGGYDPVDLTVTRNDLVWAGVQLRVGVKNLFDSEPRYLFEQPGATEFLTYPGRTYFAQLAWKP